MRRRPMTLATWCLLSLAVSLYTASFFLPAYRELEGGHGPGAQVYRIDQGYTTFLSAFIFGWPSWWANPAAWLAVALLVGRRSRAAIALAVVALVLALSAIPMATVFQFSQFHRLMTGYWTWLAASATLVLGGLHDQHEARQAARPPSKAGFSDTAGHASGMTGADELDDSRGARHPGRL